MRHPMRKLGIPPLGILIMVLALALACGTAAPADEPTDPVAADPGQPPVAEPAPTPAPPSVAESQVQRLVYAHPGFIESNFHWTYTRPNNGQNDPYLETLIDVDAYTAEFTPRLAESWQINEDATQWTFVLRQGVPFHYDFGEFSAPDLEVSRALHERDEAIATFRGVWQSAVIDVVDDHQVVLNFTEPHVDLAYNASRSGDLRIVSKAQIDQDGLEGHDRRPVGTGHFQYADRRSGEFIRYQRFDDHWSGEPAAFRELEFRIVPEASTRAAMLLAGEAHLASFPSDLAQDALARGMQIVQSQVPTDHTSFYFGGQYHLEGDPAFDSTVPWNDVRVREALNRAINRDQLMEVFFEGKGIPLYMSGFHPSVEGWNPEWDERFPQLYGYDPDRARELLAEAGYPPGTMNLTILSFTGATAGGQEFSELNELGALYWSRIGVNVEIREIDDGAFSTRLRNKELHHEVYSNSASIRPIQQRIFAYWADGGTSIRYQSAFSAAKYKELSRTFDPAERERIAREVGDYMIENYIEMPLAWIAPEIVVNPEVIAEWIFPGAGGGRFTHFNMIKAAQ